MDLAVLSVMALWAAPAPLQCRSDLAAVREIRAVATGIVEADNRRDIERVLSHYAEDAVLMPPGEPPVTGRAAIRPRYAALFEAYDPAIEPRVDEACVDSGLAFVRGHNGGRLVSRTGAAERRLDDGFLMLLRQDAQGAWRITHLIWHRESDATKATP
jgi:uncharacterized protein (TIGR02246 family)